MKDVLSNLLKRLPEIETNNFLASWESQLAYKQQFVQVITGANETPGGILLGLESDGGLRLRDENGKQFTVHYGDVSLRPMA